MISALLVAVIYCVIIMVVAWVLIALVGMLPAPAPFAGILPTIIWAIAIICCLIVLLRVVAGGLPPLMLTGLMP